MILLRMPVFFRLVRITCRSPSHSISPGLPALGEMHGLVRTSSASVLPLILLCMTLFCPFDEVTVLLSHEIFPIQSPLPRQGDQAEQSLSDG